MPTSKEEQEFVLYVVDMMQTMGPVYFKRMFGGYGVFLEGLMFALIADNVLYLKADQENENDFVVKGLGPFTYSRKGKLTKLSYYQAPEEALEDGEVMNEWGNRSYMAAVRRAKKDS